MESSLKINFDTFETVNPQMIEQGKPKMRLPKTEFLSNELFNRSYESVISRVKEHLKEKNEEKYDITNTYLSDTLIREQENRNDYTVVIFLQICNTNKFLLTELEFGTHTKVYDHSNFVAPNIFTVKMFKFPEFTPSGVNMNFETIKDEGYAKYESDKTYSISTVFDYSLNNPENKIFYCLVKNTETGEEDNYYVGCTIDECHGEDSIAFMIKEKDFTK